MNTSPASTKVSSCPTGQTESTILLVEDEPVVREVTRAVLEHAGYRVLACNGPDEALRVGSEHRENIGLLLTDVVMPGMNGAELAERLQRLRIGLHYGFYVRLRRAPCAAPSTARRPDELHPEAVHHKHSVDARGGGLAETVRKSARLQVGDSTQ